MFDSHGKLTHEDVEGVITHAGAQRLAQDPRVLRVKAIEDFYLLPRLRPYGIEGIVCPCANIISDEAKLELTDMVLTAPPHESNDYSKLTTCERDVAAKKHNENLPQVFRDLLQDVKRAYDLSHSYDRANAAPKGVRYRVNSSHPQGPHIHEKPNGVIEAFALVNLHGGLSRMFNAEGEEYAIPTDHIFVGHNIRHGAPKIEALNLEERAHRRLNLSIA